MRTEADVPETLLPPGLRPGLVTAVVGALVGGASIWVYPPILGLVSMALGAMSWWRGYPRGRWVVALGFACGVVGTLMALFLPQSFYN